MLSRWAELQYPPFLAISFLPAWGFLEAQPHGSGEGQAEEGPFSAPLQHQGLECLLWFSFFHVWDVECLARGPTVDHPFSPLGLQMAASVVSGVSSPN